MLSNILFDGKVLGEAHVRITIFVEPGKPGLCRCRAQDRRAVVDKHQYNRNQSLKPASKNDSLVNSRKSINEILLV